MAQLGRNRLSKEWSAGSQKIRSPQKVPSLSLVEDSYLVAGSQPLFLIEQLISAESF